MTSRSQEEMMPTSFVMRDKTFGIADGVGGWIKKGIDAGIYARELMSNCCLSTLLTPINSSIDPKKVLIEAHSNTKAQGSCTACIITLQDNNLMAANLGDSGFMVLREGKVIYRSEVQQTEFNHTYQLGNGKRFKSPTLAMEMKVEVQAGDVVVAGTDGLFDNMFAHEIEEMVRKKQGSEPQHLAGYLAEKALFNSLDKYSETPFSLGSKKSGGKHKGGKIDDITVIVALIKPPS